VHLSETAGRFLQINAGDPSLNLLRIIHPDLLAELRTVLLRAEGSDRAVASAPQAVVIGGERLRVVLRVSRTSEAEGNHLLVIFDSQPDGVDASEKVPGDATDAPVRDKALEQEIEDLKWHLRDLTERRDLAIEEMRSSNEELHAMNEELRSATEELETSREELQSINEELTTVNHEMKSKVDELAQSNADLQNLIAATSISAIFLSRELTISRFTPSAVQLFKLLPGDIGRPLDDLAPIVDYPQITADAQAVLSSLVAREREVPAGPRWFHVRVLPYRTQEDRIAGVVITFTDITGRRLRETAVRRSEQRMRAILDNAIEYAIVSMDLDRHVTAWNVGAERIFGWSRDEAIGQSADITFTAEDRQARAPDREADQALSHGSAADEREHVRRDGSQFWGSGVMMPLRDELGRAIGLLKILRDQTLARATQEQLVASRESLEDAFAATVVARAQLEESNRAKDRFLAILSHELRTPLTPVVMAVRALERESLPERARTMVEVIHRNVRAELHLIDDLLDVTRISAGKLALVREPVDMHVLIQEGVEVCEAEIQARRHRLRLALDAPSHRSWVTPTGSARRSGTWCATRPSSRRRAAGSPSRPGPPTVGSTWSLPIPASASRRSASTPSSMPSSRGRTAWSATSAGSDSAWRSSRRSSRRTAARCVPRAKVPTSAPPSP
jgi:two-component system CheB/CheR fusion protein